ncbi:MAG: hypothetical protein ACQESO_03840 [Bacillota bacterium]
MNQLDEGLKKLSQEVIQMTQEIASLLRMRKTVKDKLKKKQLENNIKQKIYQVYIYLEVMEYISSTNIAGGISN